MYYLLALIIVIILLLAGIGYGKDKETYSIKPDPVIAQNNAPRNFLGLKDIQKQLEVIAKTPPPKKLSPGAMCYKIAGPPNRIEYVCSVCGEKTIYSTEKQGAALEEEIQNQWRIIGSLLELEGCQRLIGQIDDKISASLDESQFCKHCSPETTSPHLTLVVNYPQEKLTHRYPGVTTDDLRLIAGFVNKKTIYHGFTDDERPIRDHLDQVKTLLLVTKEERTSSFLSRQEIKEKLQQVAQSPAPQNLSPGAMCYVMAPAAGRIHYVCPVCGEKTIYANDPANPQIKPDRDNPANRWTLYQLEQCKRIAGQINGLQIKLDESQFCKKCSPSTVKPGIMLTVSYPDPKQHPITTEIEAEDLLALKAFLDGKPYFEAERQQQIAVKDRLSRLEKFWG